MAQRVLVTAGASGIGREVARAFSANGASVFVCDIDANALKVLEGEIAGLKTGLCDVSKRQDVERMIAECADALDGLDVLVNNAGIAGPTAPVEEMDPDACEKVMAVDLTGTFNVTRLAIPYLKTSDAGVILIMSSVAGRFGYANRSPLRQGEVGADRLYQDTLHRTRRTWHSRQRHFAGRRRWSPHPTGI
jgi:NAD(P)-dependent dehydrogenase (short-subunit alcohol dehydrogenase family)